MFAAAAEDVAKGAQQARAGLIPDGDHQHDHHQVHQRPGPVEKARYPVDATHEQRHLEHADDPVGGPVDGRQAEQRGRLWLAAEQCPQQQGHRGRGEIGLHAVPEDGDDAAYHCREVRAAHTHARPRHHRERDAVLHAGLAGELHQAHDDEAGQHDARQHRPAIEAVADEQRGGEGITEQALDIVGPHVKDLEPAPFALRRGEWCEISVVQAGIDLFDLEVVTVHGRAL